jgi:hypothetical protein
MKGTQAREQEPHFETVVGLARESLTAAQELGKMATDVRTMLVGHVNTVPGEAPVENDESEPHGYYARLSGTLVATLREMGYARQVLADVRAALATEPEVPGPGPRAMDFEQLAGISDGGSGTTAFAEAARESEYLAERERRVERERRRGR